MSANQPRVTPEKILQDFWAARNTMALVSAIDLEIFTHIAGGNHTASEIAAAAQTDARVTEQLLDALVALEYLTKNGKQYGLAPVSEAFLVKGREPYIGAFAAETQLNWQAWSHLTEVVKTGRPVVAADTEEAGKEFFPKLVRAIFPMSFGAASAVAASLTGEQRDKIKNILDVAAGAAPWSLAFAQVIPDDKVTVLDYPEVTPIAREYATRFGVADRYIYIDGNLRDLDFGKEKYDLITLGHIIHSEGAVWGERLIRKCYDALTDGGLLLIAEMVPNDERTGPPMPLIFGLNMAIHTVEGGVYTMEEYTGWLTGAGFKRVWTVDAPAPSPIILAEK
jgi:ubiquinone/menaquinone biosynthesis C-methylase UbiE